MRPKNKIFWTIILGNTLDHYDTALYIFLAPFFASLFFPAQDPIIALILTYGIKVLGICSRPLGAIYFGNLARTHHLPTLLVITLTGVACTTISIAFIPSYQTIGLSAPILLVMFKVVQGFFAAGEHNLASLFALEHAQDEQARSRASGYYLFSTMMGTALASLAKWLVSISPAPEYYWRLAFAGGIFTALVTLFLRFKTLSQPLPTSVVKSSTANGRDVIKIHRWKVCKIIFITAFSFITYTIPFIFINDVAPYLTQVTTEQLSLHSIFIVMFNNLLIPVFIVIAYRFNIANWMSKIAFIFAVTIVPALLYLPSFGIWGINLFKIWIIILGVGYVVPLHALLYKLVAGRNRYLISGLGYSLGMEIIGRNTMPICLAIWHYTGGLAYCGLYLAVIALLAGIALHSERHLFEKLYI